MTTDVAPKVDDRVRKLRNAVRFAYDAQKLRIQSAIRADGKKGDAPPIELDEEDKKYLAATSKLLKDTELKAKQEIERLCDGQRIWLFLRGIRGIGPVGAGVIMAEFNIHKATYASSFWSFAGLGVVKDVPGTDEKSVRDQQEARERILDLLTAGKISQASADVFLSRVDEPAGHAPKPVKGQKLPYNSWLRSKLLFVVGGCLLKAQNERYSKYYHDYKNRKVSQLGPCVTCLGTGYAKQPKKTMGSGKVSTDAGKAVKCWNCVNNKKGMYTPDKAPWGKSDAHRHLASVRFMVKMLLADVWRYWRQLEKLPTPGTYAEDKLGLPVSAHHALPAPEESDVIGETITHNLDKDDDEDGTEE